MAKEKVCKAILPATSIHEVVLPELDAAGKLDALSTTRFPLAKTVLRFGEKFEVLIGLDDAWFRVTRRALSALQNITGCNPASLSRDPDKANRMWKIALEGMDTDDVKMIIDGDRVINFRSGDEIVNIISTIRKAMPENRVLSAGVEKSNIVVDLVCLGLSAEPIGHAGDTSYAGLSIVFGASLKAEPLILRMTHRTLLRSKFRVEATATNDIVHATNVAGEMLHRFSALHGQVVDLNKFGAVLSDANASAKDISIVMSKLPNAGGSAYDVIGLVADLGVTENRKSLAYLAGNLVDIYHATRCSSCGHII